MQLTQVTIIVVCALVAVVVAKRVPIDDRAAHHSTKKELKDPHRFPRKTTQTVDSTDLDPALAYALPPAGLLHRGQGFGLGLGLSQGYDAAALANFVSSGLQEGRQELGQVTRPVYHATPLQPYGALLHHTAATPIEEPRQEDHSNSLHSQTEAQVQAVQAQALSFVHSPKYHTHTEQEDDYKDYAAKYQFGYRVRDLHTGNDFGQTESRDGHYTQGHYHVLLPDGRLQNVQYWSDNSGFHAKVSYDGHAQHL